MDIHCLQFLERERERGLSFGSPSGASARRLLLIVQLVFAKCPNRIGRGASWLNDLSVSLLSLDTFARKEKRTAGPPTAKANKGQIPKGEHAVRQSA